jgi:hypothetical protein
MRLSCLALSALCSLKPFVGAPSVVAVLRVEVENWVAAGRTAERGVVVSRERASADIALVGGMLTVL